ncbi:MAG TPA: lysophospholipid acyltransferase family protein [Methylomirabilota bacterium]|nr:lysophospholipid acyltransferase family protein [Methylomirabilota bacterium]
MEAFWYYAAVLLAKTITALPLRLVARLGRFGGGVAYWLDARHRRVALENFRRCMPELSGTERRGMVREHYRRLGENYVSAIKTSMMSREELRPHLEIVGEERLAAHGTRGAIVAIGHFANFELYVHVGTGVPGVRRAATYRGLKQQRLEGLVRRLRDLSGCHFFERRRDGRALRATLSEGSVVLGLLADLHAGRKGLNLRFLNQECSVSAAPALFALRYNLPLHTAICFRVGLARWRIEINEEIPTRVNGKRREVSDVAAEITAAFEAAIHRDPPNWFWVHDRWRFVKRDRAAALAASQSAPTASATQAPQGSPARR